MYLNNGEVDTSTGLSYAALIAAQTMVVILRRVRLISHFIVVLAREAQVKLHSLNTWRTYTECS